MPPIPAEPISNESAGGSIAHVRKSRARLRRYIEFARRMGQRDEGKSDDRQNRPKSIMTSNRSHQKKECFNDDDRSHKDVEENRRMSQHKFPRLGI